MSVTLSKASPKATRKRRRPLSTTTHHHVGVVISYALCFALLSVPSLAEDSYASSPSNEYYNYYSSSTSSQKLRAAVSTPMSPSNNLHHPSKRPNGEGEDYSDFMEWCQEHLGITTSLEIATFYYHDTIQAMKNRIDMFDEDEDEGDNDDYEYDMLEYYYDHNHNRIPIKQPSISDYPMIPVRGLAASRDIEIGQVVIAIPHDSLWTLQVIIDQDPVLSQVMGPSVRKSKQWHDGSMDEIPLLAVALLYHYQHIHKSPYKPYLERILEKDHVEFDHDMNSMAIPHLWNLNKLRRDATKGVRRVAKGIQADVHEMYQRIVLTLVEEHPDVFGPHAHVIDDEEDEDDHGHSSDDDEEVEWMYSLERFHWAFALVNSRHWHLPLPSLTATNKRQVDTKDNDEKMESAHVTEQAAPPAAMPTDEWLDRQRQEQQDEQEDAYVDDRSSEDLTEQAFWPMGNSFLAPMADLLNFGPPCTRGVYNATTHSFEILATCKFQKGQEVTFWYADACQDVFVANYGFTHPAVPKCRDSRIRDLEADLDLALDELDRMDQQVDQLLTILEDCHCDKVVAAAAVAATGNGDVEQEPSESSVSSKPKSLASPVPPKVPVASPATVGWKKDGHSARHAIRGAQENGLRRGGAKANRSPKRSNSRKSDL